MMALPTLTLARLAAQKKRVEMLKKHNQDATCVFFPESWKIIDAMEMFPHNVNSRANAKLRDLTELDGLKVYFSASFEVPHVGILV